MKHGSKHLKCLAISVLVVAGIVGCMLAGCSTPKNPDANLTEKPQPSNGAVLQGSNSGDAAVEVTAADGQAAYVKVKRMNGNTVVAFYVRPGSSAQVSVPIGTYSVQFATGSTWYGESDRFGSGTSYGQDKGVSLGYGDLMTYTLQRSTNGNFSPDRLSESDF